MTAVLGVYKLSKRYWMLPVLFLLCFCSPRHEVLFTEADILQQLDLAFKGVPGKYFPAGRSQDIKYNFFFDLEHGYFETAGNRIHLFADSTRWAIVFEKSGYQNRATRAEIELDYVGNCIDYPVDKYPDRNYISNSSNIVLIDNDEYARIENKTGSGTENFELISQDIKQIKVRDKLINFDSNYRHYEEKGIKVKDHDNPRKLIGFGDLIRYLHEMNSSLVRATNREIRQNLPGDLPKLMTIDAFHYSSVYDMKTPPSIQEMYHLIAKVLVTRDISNWKPTLKSNNHWSNWKSGNL